MVASPFAFAFLFHLVLAFPTGKLGSRGHRAATVALYGVAATVGIGRALFYDPFFDPYCLSNCTVNSFLVRSHPGFAQALADVWHWAALTAAILLGAISVWRLASATRPALRILWAVLVPGVLVSAAESAYAVGLIRDRLEDPEGNGFKALFVARSSAVIALVLGLAWSVLASRRTRASVSGLAEDLGDAPQPGSLRTALAETVGDPRLDVAYWLPDSARYVDSQGVSVALPPPGGGQVQTPVVRGGQPVALLVHDEAALDPADLETQVGHAARLAIDNERLQAEVLAQLGDLRASRARIVETGDAERRRLERDLHDGAQQRLLALTSDLRLARAEAEADGTPAVVTSLGSALQEARKALSELRELAHGIYPAILADSGLRPALETLADQAPMPVEVGEIADQRFKASIESAAYLVVAEALEEAARRGVDLMVVSATRQGGTLMIEVRGVGGCSQLHLADRIGALGGKLIIDPGRIRAEIPCE
jgi:signal transduction histidine kinase